MGALVTAAMAAGGAPDAMAGTVSTENESAGCVAAVAAAVCLVGAGLDDVATDCESAGSG